MIVRRAAPPDMPQWAAMRSELWPGGTPEDHARDLAGAYLAGKPDMIAFVAEGQDGHLLGFVEASIRRDYVEGCDTSPVAFARGAVRGQ